MKTLWFNTGTLCNITCANCYIESSPTNDRLVYLSHQEVKDYLKQMEDDAPEIEEIGFTGGEPFMNPDILKMMEEVLSRGRQALVLTNAMRPMMRPKICRGLLSLHARYGAKIILRVSLDHHEEALHDSERGVGSFARTMEGLKWLSQKNFTIHIAGRTRWGEEEAVLREGFAALFDEQTIAVNAFSPTELILFPEMDEKKDVAEITQDCFQILNVDPQDLMCASSRMIVKRKGAAKPSVVSCTLLPYDESFEMGETLKESLRPIALNHPHCARFCVLGGGSCSGA